MPGLWKLTQRAVDVGEALDGLQEDRGVGPERPLPDGDRLLGNGQCLTGPAPRVEQGSQLGQCDEMVALQWPVGGLREADRLLRSRFTAVEVIQSLEDLRQEHITGDELPDTRLELLLDLQLPFGVFPGFD